MRPRTSSRSLGLLAIVAALACGCSKQSAPPSTGGAAPSSSTTGDATPRAPQTDASEPAPAGDAASGASDAPAGGEASGDGATAAGDPTAPGRIRGVALYTDTPPKRAELAIGSAAGCEGHATPPLSERIIVTDGKLANVFVYVSRGLEKWERTPPPSEPIVVHQTGCLYVPHASAARVGQKLVVENRDAITHNVNMKSDRHPPKNQMQGADSPPIEIALAHPDVPITLGCDIHPWMRSLVYVQDHPFFAVTGEDGSFVIEGLPPGKYTVSTAHEAFKTQRDEVVVPAGGEAVVEFRFAGK